ncbi:38045_t:CDS:2, partial [Gigaspora margarita]
TMTEFIMPKVDDKFELLEAFEDATKLAVKSNRFAFARKDSNLIEYNENYLLSFCNILKKKNAVVTKDNLTTTTEIMWVVTKVVLNYNHFIVELYKVAIFSQYCVMNLKNLIQQLHDNYAPTHIIISAVNKVINSSNNDSAQKLLKLFEEHDYMAAAKCVMQCPEVLIIDSTYKTNIYKFSLVSAIGINNSLNIFKKAAEKAHASEKVELYVQSLIKNLKMWNLAYTKHFCNMGISTIR